MRMATAVRQMLEEKLLPFWARLKDEEFGGFYGYMDFDLNLDRKAAKGCILNSRILWFFSEAAMALKSDVARDCADHAWRFLRERCYDAENGGLFWSVTYDGQPEDTTKHTYNQAFGIYALASYYRLTGCAEALDLARRLFTVIETRCKDKGGYLEAFTADWKPESNEKLSENGVMADRTMNTLLHVFEGCSGLYQATHEAAVGAALRQMLDIYADKVFDPVKNRQRVFFDWDYNELIDLHSYHDDIVLPDFRIPGRSFPDLCIGMDSKCTPPDLLASALKRFGEIGLTTDVNYPYSGTYIPEVMEGGTDTGRFAGIMLEFHRRAYLDRKENMEKIREAIRKVIADAAYI